MTFAVIQTGGKQYRVAEGDVITVEKLGDDLTVGDVVVFDSVLLFDDGKKTDVGMSTLEGKKVEGVLEAAGRNKKIEVVKWKSKINQPIGTKYGHRQPFHKIKITKVK